MATEFHESHESLSFFLSSSPTFDNTDQQNDQFAESPAEALGSLLSRAQARAKNQTSPHTQNCVGTDQAAINSLFLLCLPLLKLMASKTLRTAGVPTARCDRDDLIQAGSFGILVAIKTYDPKRGSFTTYSAPFIRRAMQRELSKQEYSVHVADHEQRAARKLYAVRAHFAKLFLREPTPAELAAALGLSERRIAELRDLESYRFTASLSDRLYDDEDITLEASIPDPCWHNGNDFRTADSDNIGMIKTVAAKLPSRDRAILYWHFGLLDGNPITNREIAARFDPPISEQRVGQILKRALQQIRVACREQSPHAFES